MIKINSRDINCIIIDDEEEACDRLESLLNKIDHLKVMAKQTSANDGIKSVIDFYPDIVFLDIEMPDKSGFDIIDSIRENNISPSFIFVTAYDQYAVKALRKTAFDYLLKPVDIDDLKKTINRFLNQRREREKSRLPQILKSQYFMTDREIEIVQFLIEGKTSKEMADALFISKHTVDTHRRNIISKAKVRSTKELFNLLQSY